MRLLLITTAAFATSLVPAAPARAEWLWPLHGTVITPYRNGEDPYADGQHRGIDIAAPVGSRVVAATAGEVRFAGTAGSSGLTVSVRTADGRFDTSYLHLSAISVREGRSVSAGDTLGAVGNTGSRSATESHLHFGVRDAGTRHTYRDPLDLLPPRPPPQAPETPQPTPAPVPVPRPVGPVASPGTEPAPRRVPLGHRTPVRVPVGGRAPRRVPVGGRVPRRVPAGGRVPRRVPNAAPAPRPVPAAERLRGRAPVSDPAPGGVPQGAPAPAPSPGGLPRGGPAADRSPRPLRFGRGAPDGPARSGLPRQLSPGHNPDGAPSSQPGPQARGATGLDRAGGPGPDIGLVFACLGLLAAAAILGLTEDGRRATRNGHIRLTRLLRPLRGRG
jgi:murein DD-endopeptidase MepM/ murein hydrolase activator NlpD